MSFHLQRAGPMPRPDVHNRHQCHVPLAAHGNGRKVTPGQVHHHKVVHINPHVQIPVYHQPVPVYHQPVPVCRRPAIVPNPPGRHYHHVHRHHHPHCPTGGTINFLGMLAKCVAISIVALFLLAVLI